MTRRQSLYVAGGKLHVNPVPDAVKMDNFVFSSGLPPVDPATGKAPDDLEAQTRLVFRHIKELMAQAGGSLDDIVKMEVRLKDASKREALNKIWNETFPDEKNRPVRHTSQPTTMSFNYLIQIEFVAILKA